jgi:hypothetical protein
VKNQSLSFAYSAVLTASVMFAGGTARAEEFPQSKTIQEFSATQGFKETSLAVLDRAGRQDQKQVSESLIEKLRFGSAYQSSRLGTKLHIAGEGWTLDVTADGSGAEYQDRAVEARAHDLGKPVSQKKSPGELEQRGRAFIADKLAAQIVLGAHEELIALRADYRTEGGQDLASGEISEAVVANRIVFGRKINGVPVVGNGSKVILTFINDGSLESFRYDWPKYREASPQNLISAGEILSRVQWVVGARDGVAAAMRGVTVPSSEGEAYPVVLTPNTQLQKLECGYYDSGSFGLRKLSSVQPACFYHAVSQDANGIRQGYAGAVPAGTQFQADTDWTESQLIHLGK